MRLFRVFAKDIPIVLSHYVLCESMDDALKMAAATAGIQVTAGLAVHDLGEPLLAWPNPRSLPGSRQGPSAGDIRASITPDALVSFEDGKHYKTLKRHLAGRGLTPVAYREKWGLPPDYPMVAPNYSAVRSALARANGLGRK